MWKLVLLLTVPFAVARAGVLFSDDFDDGDADGWTELPGDVSYQVADGWYEFSGSAPEEVMGASLNGDLDGSMSVQDYSSRARVTGTEGDPCLLARFSPFTFRGYVLLCSMDYNMAVLARIDGPASDPVPLAFTYCPLEQGQEYWIRFEVGGSLLGAKIWTGTVGDEPSNWLVLADDAAYTQPGTMGLVSMDANTGGTARIDCRFDDVVVTDELSLGLESGTWASIKRCF